jgi:hypothetical protein
MQPTPASSAKFPSNNSPLDPQLTAHAEAGPAAAAGAAAPSAGGKPKPPGDGEASLPVLDPVADYEKIKRIGEGTFGIVCEILLRRPLNCSRPAPPPPLPPVTLLCWPQRCFLMPPPQRPQVPSTLAVLPQTKRGTSAAASWWLSRSSGWSEREMVRGKTLLCWMSVGMSVGSACVKETCSCLHTCQTWADDQWNPAARIDPTCTNPNTAAQL